MIPNDSNKTNHDTQDLIRSREKKLVPDTESVLRRSFLGLRRAKCRGLAESFNLHFRQSPKHWTWRLLQFPQNFACQLKGPFFSIDETLLASRHVCYEHVHLMSLVVYASFTWYEGVVYPSCTGSVHVAISHEGKTLWQSGSLLWSRKLWAKLRNSIEPAFWFQGRTLTFWSFLNKKLWKASHTGSSQDSTRRVALHFASNLQAKNTLYLFVEQKWNVSKMFTLKDLTCLLLNDKWFHCTVLKTLLSLFWPWQKK